MARELVCWNCGKSIADVPLPISRHANCRHCFEVLRCCRLCRHYDTARPGQCDHERADPPVVKESANFCDYFKPAPGRFAARDGAVRSNAKSALEALFVDDEAGGELRDEQASNPDTSKARSKLDDLFDD